MKFPELCLPYMANDGGLASVVTLCRQPARGICMRYLRRDESGPCVLDWRAPSPPCPGTRKRSAPDEQRPLQRPRRIPNELFPLYPPCHGRAAPGGGDFVRHRHRAREIAGCNAAGGEHLRPGNNDAFAAPEQDPPRRRGGPPADSRRHPRRPNTGSDRRSVRRGNHVSAENGCRPQRHAPTGNRRSKPWSTRSRRCRRCSTSRVSRGPAIR